jgi:hypothetical protein
VSFIATERGTPARSRFRTLLTQTPTPHPGRNRPGKIFDKEGQAYPRISFTQWKDGKAVLVFSGYGE